MSGKIIQMGKKPETHIHCAVTLVEAGDPYSIMIDNRKDKTHELCQFAARWEKQTYGQLPAEYVIKAFAEMTELCLNKMREAGVLRNGD